MAKGSTISDTRVCRNCGAVIQLVQTGPQTYKWVTNPLRFQSSWKCGRDPDFPLRSHEPKESSQ